MPPDSAKFPSGPTKVWPTSSAREAGIPNPLVSPVNWSLANVPDRMSLLTKKFDVSTRLVVAPMFSVTVVVIVGLVTLIRVTGDDPVCIIEQSDWVDHQVGSDGWRIECTSEEAERVLPDCRA